jgi:hypothetical protein
MKASRLLVLVPILLFVQASPAQESRRVSEVGFDFLSGVDGFLTYHPDVRYRKLGQKAYAAGRYDEAFRRFERASRFADKPSQAMVAEMYWQGLGVPADRVLAYIWMDLSAERGYPDFLNFRERYWEQLDAGERTQVAARAPSVLDQYADVVARPRLEGWLRRGLSKVTGSRTGWTGGRLAVWVQDGMGGSITLDGRDYYADTYWRPREYWRLQDEIWRAPARERVEVGAPRTLAPEAGAPAHSGEEPSP